MAYWPWFSAGVPQASAQSYPSRNITAIIPFAPGNANDITARIVLEQVGKQIGQTIVIDNRGGAGGTIGVGRRRAPTRTATPSCSIRRRSVPRYVTHKTLPYDTLNDFIAVAAVGIQPSVLVAAPSKG